MHRCNLLFLRNILEDRKSELRVILGLPVEKDNISATSRGGMLQYGLASENLDTFDKLLTQQFILNCTVNDE
jgi:hypothetical protein